MVEDPTSQCSSDAKASHHSVIGKEKVMAASSELITDSLITDYFLSSLTVNPCQMV
jgi:hypothetical protein